MARETLDERCAKRRITDYTVMGAFYSSSVNYTLHLDGVQSSNEALHFGFGGLVFRSGFGCGFQFRSSADHGWQRVVCERGLLRGFRALLSRFQQ